MILATIVGARPQFIKAAVLSRTLAERQRLGAQIREIIIHTGQHYDANMSDTFFQEMEIPKPNYHLGIGGISHGAMTGRMLEAIEEVLVKEKPDWVLVYGDTNSTLAGALAAVKMHIPVAHVEAGLRSFNKKMPEEINRIVADHCSDLLFTPSEVSTKQLLKEGISPSKIIQSGDIMFDAALHYGEKAVEQSQILTQLGVSPKQYALATVHRAENTDDPERLKEIVFGLNAIADYGPVIFPLHPRTRKALEANGLYPSFNKRLAYINPVGYLDMIRLESQASVILTDSGGVQKEAYFFRTPCITLRDETEWVELIECGFNRLAPLKRQEILKEYLKCRDQKIDWNKFLYGDGKAAHRIISALNELNHR